MSDAEDKPQLKTNSVLRALLKREGRAGAGEEAIGRDRVGPLRGDAVEAET